MERARLLAQGHTIRAADLGSSLAASSSSPRPDSGPVLPSLDLAALERMAIERALERTKWHQGLAAELLGISPRTLHRKIRGLGLARPR
jgi:transcriptional regulator of acetoin/glycerol metabolism